MTRRRAPRLHALATLAAAALVAPAARAEAPSAVDMVEHMLGASNTNAVAGHGALTCGVSIDGDLTVLSWPGPSFADQLAYVSGNDLDVRDRPHFGAHDGMGSYVGLLVTTAQGTALVWLRDRTFTHAQRYTQPDAPVIETTFRRADLGLTVVLTDVVSPDVDLLTRRVVVTRAAGSPVSGASLVVYENLSPTLSKLPMVPLADWALDSRADFAAAYDRAARAVVHVHPGDRGVITSLAGVGEKPEALDYGDADALMRRSPTDADVDAFLASADTAFPPGVAAIVTTDPPPASFQVGNDATPICAVVGRLADNIKDLARVFPGFKLPLDPSIVDAVRCVDTLPQVRAARGWTFAPEDALADLADGKLSGSRFAAGQTNAALVAPLAFAGDVAEGAALFALGKSVADARSALAQGTRASAAERQAAAEKVAHDVLGAAKLPDPALGERVVQVAARALVNLYVARDRGTGAIVASVTRQPPYALDWPRDGSFFTQAIDLAGLSPWGTARGVWYTGVQRREPAPRSPLITPIVTTDPDTGDDAFPAFAWEMNYFADGTIGGPIRFEIDNTALHLWAMVTHAATLRGADRQAFVSRVWPTSKDALHLLVRWRDRATGLPWLANEDDHVELTSTLHGAVAVYAGLVAGARLARAAGDDAAAHEALARSTELRGAILAAYYDTRSGLFRDAPQKGTDYIPGTTGSGATAWLAWPGRVLDPGDARLEAQLAADMTAVLRDIRGETEGGAYVMKTVLAAALLGRDGGARDMAREAVRRLADIATPDTLHFGEVFVTTHPAGAPAPVFSARVAQPHVWEGTLFYLSAMALSSPGSFDPETRELPLPSAGVPVEARGGCAVEEGRDGAARSGAGDPSWVLAVLGLAGAAVMARRQRRAADPPPT